MGVRKVGMWPARVLPGLCAFLVLLSHAATGLRILHNDGSLQPDTEQSSFFLVHPRRLAEVETGEHADEDTAMRGIKHMMLGGGKERLGIHGEGLGFAHALLESDAEVMAMAAALKGGNVFAEGHGLEKAADDGEAEEADDESAGSPAANVAPQRPGRLEKVAEKLAEAARSRDGPAENGAAAEVANGGQMEGTPAADTAEQPDQAAKPVKAAAKEEPAGREADAMPPWFSRKTTAAVETVKRPVEHTHGAGRHSTRRARHSNRCHSGHCPAVAQL